METMTGDGPCSLCDRDPAAGYASIVKDGVEHWYCHDEVPNTCYEKAVRSHAVPMSESAFLRWLGDL